MKRKIKDKVVAVDGDIALDVASVDNITRHTLFKDLRSANKMLRLQKKKLLQERNSFKRWGEDLSLLNELSKSVVSTLDTDKIILTAYTRMQKIVPHDILTVVLFKQKKLWVLANIKLHGEELEEIKALALSVIKEIVNTSDEDSYKMAIKCLKRDRPQTSDFRLQISNRLFFPIEVGDSRIGTLYLIRYSDEPFSEHQYNIASMIASTLTLALRNSEIHREVQEMATIDSLTGLFNKRYFLDMLNKEFKSMMRYQNPVSLIMLDMDNFKPINDQFGHQVGDMVLREIASLLTRSLREIDIPSRYGGDEIAIILPETVMEQAYFVAKRIKRLIEEYSIRSGENCIKVTASFGISSCPDSEIKSAEDMIVAADKALYEAKRYGRNRIEADKDIFTQDNAYMGPLVF